MKRKITMITACILSCMLMVCIVPGSYAEISDETILNENDSPVTEEVSETTEEPGDIPDETPALQEAPAAETEENPAGEQSEDAGESGIVNDTEPESEPEPVSEPEQASESEAGQESVSEPEQSPASGPEQKTEPEAVSEFSSETETEAESEPESIESADQPRNEEPETTETEEDKAAGEANADPDEPDEDGLFEFDDDDHGYIEPSAMPEELATVTPEMRFEGITELTIGAEVSGTATAAPGSYHYIRSGSARTVLLTLYAGADIQVQVNDQPVQTEATEDADGNECLACRVNLRDGETFISLIGASVSYRLKASLPVNDKKAEEETPEEESPTETADEPATADDSTEADTNPAEQPAATDPSAEAAEESEAPDASAKAETAGEPAAADPSAETAEEPATDNPSAEMAEEPETTEVSAEAETEEEPAEVEMPAVEADEAYIAFDDPDAVMSAHPVEKDKERHVEIHSSIDDLERVYCNSYVKMSAELFGYEGMDCTVQWFYSPDHGVTWIAIPGANKLKYIYQINEENFHYIWSVKVTPADG